MKLILLEDDPVILICTQDALTEAGFEVFPAVNGTEALALLAETPDCLAMMVDVRLADGLNGWEVARRARDTRPDLAIIYTTTADGPDYERDKWGRFARAVLRRGELWGMRYSHARIAISRVIQSLIRSR